MIKTFTNRFLLFIVAILFVVNFGYAQNSKTASHNISIQVPAVALLSVHGSTDINLTPIAPTQAGHALDFTNANNSSIWLNVSSIVGQNSKSSREVAVKIESGTMPPGIILKVRAANANTNGAGNLGSVQPELILNNNNQTIINNIGSCYTGIGVSSGYNITYALVNSNYSDIKFNQNTFLTVAYTISD